MSSTKVLLVLLLIQNFNSIFNFERQIKRFNGFKVFRITPQTDEQLNYLKQLSENNFEANINFQFYF